MYTSKDLEGYSMIQMCVSAQKADELLSNIDNAIFQQGRESHWQTYMNQNGQAQAPAQSICWLFCWAATGRGSENAQKQAQHAFDAIFDTSYDSLSQHLDLEEARKYRYLKGNDAIPVMLANGAGQIAKR